MVIVDTNAARLVERGESRGGHLALKGTAGPGAASMGGTADSRVGSPGDNWP